MAAFRKFGSREVYISKSNSLMLPTTGTPPFSPDSTHSLNSSVSDEFEVRFGVWQLGCVGSYMYLEYAGMYVVLVGD